MHDARVAPANIAAVYSVVVDALTRRMLELAVAEAGDAGVEFAWLALGSQARREALPSSDVDSAIVWFGASGRRSRRVGGCMRSGRPWSRGSRPAGCAPTSTARRPPIRGSSARSIPGSARSASWIDDPTQEKALVLVSVLVDSRPVWGVHTGTPVADSFRLAPSNPALLRLLARFALSHRPPTGFFRGLVVEPTGEHRGQLDLKQGGVTPDRRPGPLGRHGGGRDQRVDSRAAARRGRRRDALRDSRADARGRARADHRACASSTRSSSCGPGEEPDDYVDPATLSGLTRSYLREAFRAVASVQKHVVGRAEDGRAMRLDRFRPMTGDWRDWRPAIWLTMLGIAVMLLFSPFYLSGRSCSARPIGAAVRIHQRRRRAAAVAAIPEAGGRSGPRHRR